VAKHGSDWIIQRHIVREAGVVLAGPDPKTIIDPITPDGIRCAVLGILHEWWFRCSMIKPGCETWEQLPRLHSYHHVPRASCIETWNHVSKPAAVRWAREKLGTKGHPLIEQATASQYGIHSEFLNETLEFMRFIKEQKHINMGQLSNRLLVYNNRHEFLPWLGFSTAFFLAKPAKSIPHPPHHRRPRPDNCNESKERIPLAILIQAGINPTSLRRRPIQRQSVPNPSSLCQSSDSSSCSFSGPCR